MTEQIETPKTEGKTAAQGATSLWAELGPALSFIIIYAVMNRMPEGEGLFAKDTAIFWATGALMAFTAFVIVTKLSKGQKIPPMLLLTGSVVGVFGALTIALHQQAFAYVKPTIINSLFAIILFGGLAIGRNFWKLMLQHAFNLPDHAWNVLAIRWGLYFIFLALLNEYLWRTYCPLPETPLSLLGLTIAPTEPYSFLGLQFGTKDAESVWAWMKIGNVVITFVFMLINLPYTLKHWIKPEESEA